MTLLDRFRTQPGQHHPDPAVRLAFVEEIPMDASEVIAAIAKEDADPRVRRAAVSKLLVPSELQAVARDDSDEGVRELARAMLLDIAREVFEGLGENESLAAVDALGKDEKILGQVAKEAVREVVAFRALSQISDARGLGSVARRAASESVRQRALAVLREQDHHEEILAVAMNGEHKDTALAAVDLLTERASLELVEARGHNKAAVKRARTLMREADERAQADVNLTHAVSASESGTQSEPVDAPPAVREGNPETVSDDRGIAEEGTPRAPQPHRPQEPVDSTVETAPPDQTSLWAGRLAGLCDEAEAVVEQPDLSAARKALGRVRREWHDVAHGKAVAPELRTRLDRAIARLAARDAAASDAQVRARREALNRLLQLATRVESLLARTDFSLKAGERAARDLRGALESTPPLPSREDYQEITRRLTAAQSALMPRVLELREAAEWQRFVNAGIQEQLCARMESLRTLEDPDRIAREVRDLQQKWREAADVPRAHADALWRRFKAAHDEVWTRADELLAQQTELRASNLQKKLALCERAEALADSTNWIQTAEALKQMQAEWKSIGPVTRGSEKTTWDRFRSACDRFFTRRHEDLAARKKVWSENLLRKEALCQRAEALADSTDWDAVSAELKHLQSEWRSVGPVKKSRSEAIWQRFRAACDRFFERYAARHDTARAERIAARESICAELEALATPDHMDPPPDLIALVKNSRSRWQQEIAARGVDPERARALEARFFVACSALVARWPSSFTGTELDPDANRRRREKLVARVEELAESLTGPTNPTEDSQSSTTRLAAMLKEALAANTIGGRTDDGSRLRAAAEELRQARAAWARLGPIPAAAVDESLGSLEGRFHRACQRIAARAGTAQASSPRPVTAPPGRQRRHGGSNRVQQSDG